MYTAFLSYQRDIKKEYCNQTAVKKIRTGVRKWEGEGGRTIKNNRVEVIFFGSPWFSLVYFPDLGLLGVELLPESDTELLAQSLEVLEVLLVLFLGLDLGLDTCFCRQG